MSYNEPVVSVRGLSKCYEVYAKPEHRLRQIVMPRLQRLFGGIIKRYYTEFWALRKVSFDLEPGETLGILGRNGSGKSTLLQIICGTLRSSGGQAKTVGSLAALLELGSGFNPEFTGRENILLYGRVLGLTGLEIHERLPRIIEFADIGSHIDQPVKTYSSGMAIRLAFAVSVVREPDILVVDEALAVGDVAFQRKCFARLEQLRKQGTTILFVSHSMAMVTELCDRAIVIDKGELLYDGIPKRAVALYTKLSFSSPEKHEDIRLEILAENEFKSKVEKEVVCRRSSAVSLGGNQQKEQAFYAPDFVSESFVSYLEQGAKITDCRIENLQGEQVNNLIIGEEYLYTYNVSFQRDVAYVQFGMLIKTKTGIGIGGTVYPSLYDTLEKFSAEGEVKVCFKFQCMLNAGVYFINAGVNGEVGGGSGYLHRIVDAVIFRVCSPEKQKGTGHVDFYFKSEVRSL